MYQVNMLEVIRFDDEEVLITEVMVTPFSKEYLITMQRHQVMIDHESSDPVTFHIMEGLLRVKIEEDERILRTADILALEGDVVHHLEALDESLLRLTIHQCPDDG